MESKARRRQLRTLYCPSCGTRGSLREILYGLPAEEPDGNKYVVGGCTGFGSLFDIACIDCPWEGIRKTIDGSELSIEWLFVPR